MPRGEAENTCRWRPVPERVLAGGEAVNRKRWAFVAAIVLLAFCSAAAGQPSVAAAQQTATSIEVYFSPHGGCTDAIVKQIDGARETILVQAYSFTSAPIAEALLQAHKRGVNVQVILDKSQRTEKYTAATFLQNVGIPTFIDEGQPGIARNKIMVIDGHIVITGSFNFTKAAEENNAENLLVIRDSDLAAKYTKNWQEHLEHSVPYEHPVREQRQW
jgi:phosphatidylserine/phosphatidylglycerophosphate/cardiolipin synthase-like enzyme